jgi:putative transcriptional regulator
MWQPCRKWRLEPQATKRDDPLKQRARDSMKLQGKFLIAMLGMADPRFERSVILLCAHSEDGAMGLIINKPNPDLRLSALTDHLGIPRAPEGRDIRVHVGGPVERGRGFVLHSDDWSEGRATMAIPGGYGMTATTDILEALAGGRGPRDALLALGYSGWGPGQLESEIRRNDWLIADAVPEVIFDANDAGKWSRALKTLGIDPVTLSSSAGRA